MDVISKQRHKYSRHSHPKKSGMAAGHILLAASIVLSGGTFKRVS